MWHMKISEITNKDLAKRPIILRPPEPPSDIIIDDPVDSIYIGRTKIFSAPFFWNHMKLTNPHIAIVGITGSGKSYLVKTFLTRASFVWGANALIIDWAGEYKDWVKQTNGKIISLGKGSSINLLDLANMRPIDRIKQVIRTLEILSDLGQYPEQVRLTEQAIEESYVQANFKLTEKNQLDSFGNSLTPPTLKDVQRIMEEWLARGKYEFPLELENAIHRIKQFTREGDDYFSQQSTVSLDEITTSGLVDLDLSGLPDENFRALAAFSILQFLKEKMRMEGWKAEKGIKLFVVLDEAWKVSREENSDAVMIVREGRKYQFGLIVASQNPTDINEAIFSNVGTTFILRVKFEKYLNYLQGSLNFSDYMRQEISRFGVGQAAVNLAFQISGDYPETFLIEKIEGEEPVQEYFLDLRVFVGGGLMTKIFSFEKTEMRKRLRDLGLNEEHIEELTKDFEKNDRHLNIVNFISNLERFGVQRIHITSFLKEIGLDDPTIITIFTQSDMRKRGVGEKTDEVTLS